MSVDDASAGGGAEAVQGLVKEVRGSVKTASNA